MDLYVLRWYAGLINKILSLLKRDIDVIAIIDDFGELIYRSVGSALRLLCIWMFGRDGVGRFEGTACTACRPLPGPLRISSPLCPHTPPPHSEIDYTAEAANAQRFVELYGGLPDIFVPRVYTELSTRKVCVCT